MYIDDISLQVGTGLIMKPRLSDTYNMLTLESDGCTVRPYLLPFFSI